MKDTELSAMQFAEMPGDVVADVFAQRARENEKKKDNKKKCTIM